MMWSVCLLVGSQLTFTEAPLQLTIAMWSWLSIPIIFRSWPRHCHHFHRRSGTKHHHNLSTNRWLRGGGNIYLDTSAGVLDCLGDIKGLGDFAECEARSIEVDLGGFSIRVLTREALILAKKAMGRPKDLQTVTQLEIGGELEAG